jgi:hypothetical protein
MNNNINPAIIIGLGGTGQWVLTHVKNNLLERFEIIPPQIKLLSFDTTSEESEVYKKENTENVQEDEVKVGPVKLVPGEEFVYLGGNIKQTCEQIQSGKFSHIGSWLQSEDYLRTLSDDDFNLSRGAGQRRQFGRMALFLDLMSINTNKVIGKISSALQSIASMQKKAQAVDVYLISSIAGGTGSGMFIDIAHLTRFLAQRDLQNAQITVRGFMVLHNTFQSVIRVEQIKPQAYAAIRELNRFMTMFSEEYPINYSDNPNTRELRTVYKSKLFDNCFLVDSDRLQSSLRKEKPQYGVYPSVADCITMMLDPSAGDTFQQHYKNVNNRIVEIQKRKPFAMYSSLGIFSFILPVEDMINAGTFRFADEFLNTYFVQKNSDTKVSKDNFLSDVKDFLRQASTRSGVENSAFVQQIGAFASNFDLDDESLCKQISSKGIGISEMFEPFGKTVESSRQGEKLHELTQIRVIDRVLPSKQFGDTHDIAAGRIMSEVEDIKNKILGNANSGKGELSTLLRQMNGVICKQFRFFLHDKILEVLNDVKREKRKNRLGYSVEFLRQTIIVLDRFIELLEKSQGQKSDKAQRDALDDLQKSRERLEDSINNRSVFDVIKQKISSRSEEDFAQENYINSSQYLIEVEIEKILYMELLVIARKLSAITQGTLAQIENWMNIWVTGDKTGNRIWVDRMIQDFRESLKQQRHEKNLIPVHRYLTDEKYEERLYKRISENKFEGVLNRFIWRFGDSGDEINLNLSLDGSNLPNDFQEPNTVSINYQRLIETIRPYFDDIRRETIASRMEDTYQPEKFAEEMAKLSAPLLNVWREDEAALEQEIKTFVSIDKKPAINYVSKIEGTLQQKTDAIMIDAADPYRCVVISTQDLIGIEAVQSLNDARQAYDIQVDDHRQKQQLHIFPAEIHAVGYEKRLGDHPFYYFKKKPHQFSHKVVMLLENLDRFELFMLAYALGIIQIEDSPDHRRLQYYVLRLQREQKFDQAFWVPLSVPDAKPSLFEAMHTFIFNKPNKPGMDASLLICSIDGDRFVEKRRIEKAIDQYEESIQWGLDYQIRPFVRFLENLRLAEDMHSMLPVLESEFRYFLMDSTTLKNKLADAEKIQSNAKKWLENMRDLNIQYHQEIVDKASELIIQARSLMRDNKDIGRLRRHLEEYVILEKVPELINSKKAEERDLGIMMHMIVWDYIQRLENRE